jgi:hypothetical protein
VVQWKSDGELDDHFGQDGHVSVAATFYRDHDVASDGEIYVLAAGSAAARWSRATTKDGQLDLKFGADGTRGRLDVAGLLARGPGGSGATARSSSPAPCARTATRARSRACTA